MSSNVAQRCSPLPSTHYVIGENLSVVAGECLTVLWKLICIEKAECNEKAELNTVKKKLSYGKDKLRRLQACHMAKINK